MHLNPVVFAVCYWLSAKSECRDSLTLERLVNFGFQKSGISCADKMRAFNSEVIAAVDDVDKAAALYNQIASEAGNFCSAFTGAESLLEDLSRNGIRNFITSAVEQDVLDEWASSLQGKLLAANINEILGKRPQLSKGREHFEYLKRNQAIEKMILVADAVSEIESAKRVGHEFNMTAIGFANVINQAQVMEAFRLTRTIFRSQSPPLAADAESLFLQGDLIELPSGAELERSLYAAGADYVVTGTANEITGNLHSYLRSSLQLL